jgi:alkylation response protein AidB-like acyl-CoA dehydrogenase
MAAAAVETVAQRCASTAMVFLMHLCGIACYAAAGDKMRGPLRNAAAGAHLATLAFSEPGSRSHFWAPVSQAADSGEHVRLTARKSFVTSAGHAEAMSRRLLKFSGGSVDDYATFSTSTASPSC